MPGCAGGGESATSATQPLNSGHAHRPVAGRIARLRVPCTTRSTRSRDSWTGVQLGLIDVMQDQTLADIRAADAHPRRAGPPRRPTGRTQFDQEHTPRNARQAILAFNGDVYLGKQARVRRPRPHRGAEIDPHPLRALRAAAPALDLIQPVPAGDGHTPEDGARLVPLRLVGHRGDRPRRRGPRGLQRRRAGRPRQHQVLDGDRRGSSARASMRSALQGRRPWTSPA